MQITQIKGICTEFLWILPFLLVFSTVFVVSNDLAEGVVSGKYFWFYGAMLLTGLSVFIHAVFHKRTFHFSVLDILIVLFAGCVNFSALIINNAPFNTTKLVLFALLVILYFCFRLFFGYENAKQQLYEEKNTNAFSSMQFCTQGITFKNILCLFLVVTGLIEAIWGLRQLYGFGESQHSLFKITGSFFNPGPYAGYLAVIFPLALYFLVHGVRCITYDLEIRIPFVIRYLPIVWKITSGITCIVILLILPASMSRASWLAALAGSLVVLFGHYRNRFIFIKYYYQLHRKKIIVLSVAMIILLCTAFTGMYLLKKDSADGRSLMWKISIQTIKQHPFGVGLGNFSGAYGDTQATYFANEKATETEKYISGSPEYAFNEYLQIAVESGVVSLLFFISIIIVSIYNLIKSKECGIAGSLISLLVFALFSYPFSILPYLIILVFLLSIANPRHNAKGKHSIKISGILAFLCAILVSACSFFQYPIFKAYKKWNTDKLLYNIELYEDAVDNYKELYPLLNDRIQFLFEYAQSLSKTKQYIQSNEVLERATQISCDPMLYNIMGKNYQALKDYKKAEDCYVKATYIAPNRLYPWYLLSKLYNEAGQKDKACEMAKIVLVKEPKVQSMAVKEMREEMKEICR